MSVRVIRDGDQWVVADDQGVIIESSLGNGAAWRLADKLALEPNTRAESVNQWVQARNDAEGCGMACQASAG